MQFVTSAERQDAEKWAHVRSSGIPARYAKGMDSAELKKEFGKDIVFHGAGIDSQYTLPYGTPDEVRKEVKRRMNDLSESGGLIFTPVHSIQYDVPFENFAAMLETYRECAGK